MQKDTYFIFDFDSTITSVEALDVLAEWKSEHLPIEEKEELIERIVSLTNEAMQGRLSFQKALEKRLDLLQLQPDDITHIIPILKTKISKSFLHNSSFFETYRNNIFVISGGFEEYIIPVVETLGIHPDHVLANRFITQDNGFLRADTEQVLAHDKGKVFALQALPMDGQIVVVGDGYTDYEMKALGKATTFYLYAEHCNRSVAIPHHDGLLFSLDDLINTLHD